MIDKRKLCGALVAAACLTLSAQANAADFTAADMNIAAGPNGSYSATFGNSGIGAGMFTDTYSFTLPDSGLGSGAVTTSTAALFSVTDLDLYSVTINGTPTTTNSGIGAVEFSGISGVPITAGVLNKVVITGLSRGNGSYGANASFSPAAVPETATWAMMLGGFGLMGASMRKSRKAAVSYA